MKQKTIRTFIFLLMTIFTVLSSSVVFAEENPTNDSSIIASGTCGYNYGNNLIWTVDDDGVLTISGTGEMRDYENNGAPWRKYTITSLVLEEGITTIGDYAFSRCSDFTGDLLIPKSVTTIGFCAFFDCTGFTGDLIIPENVTSIQGMAFSGCNGFSNLIISEGVTSIGEAAFFNCTGLTGDLVIPESVTSIGYEAFYNCSGFTGKLVIPDGVTSIRSEAFYNCSGFTGELVIPESISLIESETFYKCSGFTGGLVIPENIEQIGNNAFLGCSGFDGNLIISENVTTIGTGAFSGCSGFTGDLIIPESVTSIETIAFYSNSGFTGNLIIPEGITSIGESAFSNCSGFTGNLIIPESVTSIGKFAFSGCSGFDGNLIIREGISTIGYGAFNNCSGFTGDLIIPESVTALGAEAFKNCAGFNGNLVVPGSVKGIHDRTFSGCSEFRAAYISDGVDYIGRYYVLDKNVIIYSYYNLGQFLDTSPVEYLNRDTEQQIDIIPVSTMDIGEKKKLSYFLYPYNSDKWDATVITCDDESVVSIDEDNYLTAKKSGNATITITNGNISEQVIVNVRRVLKGISLNQNEITASKGEQIQLELSMTPLDANDFDKVLWESSNKEIATVDQNGLVTITGAGSVNITAKVNSYTAMCSFVCPEVPLEGISINEKTKNIECGSDAQLTSLLIPANSTDNFSITWSSNNEDVVKVNSGGKIEAVRPGTAVIIAKVGSYKSECKVTVSHNIKPKHTVNPTCIKSGYTTYSCACGYTYKTDYKNAIGHSYGSYKTTAKAGFNKKGTQIAICKNTNCTSKKTKTIAALKTPTLSTKTYTFNNKVKKPAVTVKNTAGTSISKSVSYANGRKSVGKYAVKVTVDNANYKGTKTLYFKINPAKPASVKLTKGKKQFKVSWKKPSATYRKQITGYQIRYATTSAKLSKAEPVTVKGSSVTSKTIKSLKAKKKYYVQVRTYKTVKGVKYYSDWSAKKYITTK